MRYFLHIYENRRAIFLHPWKSILFFFIDFFPKIKFRMMHVMEYLGEFHKSTRRGDFVKIFGNVHKMEHFRKFLLVFKWENTIHKNYTHIFSKHKRSEFIESTPQKIFGRFAPEMCTIWRKSHYQRISQNIHILQHLGESHKSTRRGYCVKIFKNVHKMQHFWKFLHVFKWEFIKIIHIFCQKKKCSDSIESTPS